MAFKTVMIKMETSGSVELCAQSVIKTEASSDWEAREVKKEKVSDEEPMEIKLHSELLLDEDDSTYGDYPKNPLDVKQEDTAPSNLLGQWPVIFPEEINMKPGPDFLEEGTSTSSAEPGMSESREVEIENQNEEFVFNTEHYISPNDSDVACEKITINTDERIYDTSKEPESYEPPPETSQQSAIHSDQTFRCRLSSKSFKSEMCLKFKNLTARWIKHFDNRHFECSRCSKWFKSEWVRDQHEANHTDDGRFACKICSAQFKTEAYLKYVHSKVHAKFFSCHHCFKTFKQKKRLRKHLTGTHPNDISSLCRLCLAEFETEDCLSNHETTTHSADKRSSCQLSCELCSLGFKTEDDLRKHEESHSVAKHFTCELCSMGFKTEDCLRKHEASHSDKVSTDHEKSADPEVIPRIAENPVSNEVLHLSKFSLTDSPIPVPGFYCSNTDEEQFSCDECPAKFKSAVYLEIHAAIHPKKKYVCHHCSKRFKHVYELNHHFFKTHHTL